MPPSTCCGKKGENAECVCGMSICFSYLFLHCLQFPFPLPSPPQNPHWRDLVGPLLYTTYNIEHANQLTHQPNPATQAKCSCGEKKALECDCGKAESENKIEGARCSCRELLAFLLLAFFVAAVVFPSFLTWYLVRVLLGVVCFSLAFMGWGGGVWLWFIPIYIYGIH